MNKFYINPLLLISVVLVFIFSCSVLPSKKNKQVSNWDNFYLAYEAFEKVEINKTTIIELQDLGFDPFESTNIAIENYLNIRNRFDPNNLGINMPKSVQECLALQENCKAYVATISHSNEDRVGNPFLDITGFHKETHILGWDFQAIFIIKNNIVIYKLWAGQPNKKQIIHETKPLGPLQDVSDIVTGAGKSLIL